MTLLRLIASSSKSPLTTTINVCVREETIHVTIENIPSTSRNSAEEATESECPSELNAVDAEEAGSLAQDQPPLHSRPPLKRRVLRISFSALMNGINGEIQKCPGFSRTEIFRDFSRRFEDLGFISGLIGNRSPVLPQPSQPKRPDGRGGGVKHNSFPPCRQMADGISSQRKDSQYVVAPRIYVRDTKSSSRYRNHPGIDPRTKQPRNRYETIMIKHPDFPWERESTSWQGGGEDAGRTRLLTKGGLRFGSEAYMDAQNAVSLLNRKRVASTTLVLDRIVNCTDIVEEEVAGGVSPPGKERGGGEEGEALIIRGVEQRVSSPASAALASAALKFRGVATKELVANVFVLDRKSSQDYARMVRKFGLKAAFELYFFGRRQKDLENTDLPPAAQAKELFYRKKRSKNLPRRCYKLVLEKQRSEGLAADVKLRTFKELTPAESDLDTEERERFECWSPHGTDDESAFSDSMYNAEWIKQYDIRNSEQYQKDPEFRKYIESL
eukprot:jgi/Bigna1/72715/fgenesh1_pg.21_\